jgi:Uma2 family endonuclease
MTALHHTWGEVFEVPAATSAADLLRLPDDGYKNELYEGALVREMTTPGHGEICQRLGGELYIYAKATGLPNRIVQNALFDLTPPGAVKRTVLAPDLAILRAGAALPWDAVPRQAPLLAVEVVSDSRTLAELAVKAQVYRHAGVDEVWIVDHRSRTVEVWDARGTSALADTQALTTALLPGFSLAVGTLLDG